MDTTIRRVVPVGPRRRGEPEADNKATQAVNPNQTRRKYSCLKCYCQNFYKIKEKKGPTHSPRPASPHKHILHPKFYTQNTHKYTKTFQHSPPPTTWHKKQSHTVRQTNFHQAISSIGQPQERQFAQLQRTPTQNNKSSLPSNTRGHHICQPERTFLHL